MLPAVASVAAGIWMFGRFRTFAGSFLLAVLSVALFSSPQLPNGLAWTIMPDYHVWIVPITLICIGLLIREYPGAADRLVFITSTVMIGLAAGMKLTFGIFPPAVLAAQLCRLRSLGL
jgi:hypothetical protein